ncbi:hypothetical protein F511_43629 [Dorcoceras hygrometricum]|uniref:Uncharacterized protein n=1 Tax=Dorcoceras hygrometricum TaxID=472368 RepID=A0A2Z7A822_9LAMI|nr:hypothetical protein F511_43629 [Dorcoceras hygrometricum]
MDSPRRTGRKQISGDDRRRRVGGGGDGVFERGRRRRWCLGFLVMRVEWIQLAVGPQPLWLRNHNSGPAQRIRVKRLATSPHDRKSYFSKSSSRAQHIELSIRAGISNLVLCDPQWFRDTASRGPTTIVAPESQFRTYPTDHGKASSNTAHDPLGITDSACKNQSVVVSVLYGPFNPYIPIRSTTIDSIGYPRMSASGESSTTMHRLLHASGSHPIPTPYDPKTNQYNQDLGLIHSTNGNDLESPKEGSSIVHQVTIYLHAQNITMFPTNETWYFASHILVSNSGGLILILTAQSTRNMFRIHSDY